VAWQLRNGTFDKNTCPFDQADRRSDNMANHTEKTTVAPLIHHPSDALDFFGCYDSSSRAWSDFDSEISDRIAEFERSHLHYLRHSADSVRRSSWAKKPRQ
jgi:hypothetical protein